MSVDITVEGSTKLFKFPVGWTVLDVENWMRIEYLIQGGGLKLNGVATDVKDSIAVSGKYEFVGEQRQAQGKTALLYIAVSLIILYRCSFDVGFIFMFYLSIFYRIQKKQKKQL